MLSPPGPYVTPLQAAGFRTLTVPMQRRSLNPVRANLPCLITDVTQCPPVGWPSGHIGGSKPNWRPEGHPTTVCKQRCVTSVNQIRRLYARERPDLVHHFTIKCVVYGALAARMAGIPACVNAVTGLRPCLHQQSSESPPVAPPGAPPAAFGPERSQQPFDYAKPRRCRIGAKA